jgi:hypothetical protein
LIPECFESVSSQGQDRTRATLHWLYIFAYLKTEGCMMLLEFVRCSALFQRLAEPDVQYPMYCSMYKGGGGDERLESLEISSSSSFRCRLTL